MSEIANMSTEDINRSLGTITIQTMNSVGTFATKAIEALLGIISFLRIGQFVAGLIVIAILVCVYILVSNHMKRLEEDADGENESASESASESESASANASEPFVNRCKF